jgi:hypothetical protein
MAPRNLKNIDIENLRINLDNPRYEHRSSEREAVVAIVHDQGQKLVNLARDLTDKGPNPSDIPIVTPTTEIGIYTVLEGNRRVAALKLLFNTPLLDSLGLPAAIVRKFKEIQPNAYDELRGMDCVVLSQEDANYWIMLKHTGENEGVGVVGWDGRASHRFRGSSPALQAVDLVEQSNYLDDETRKKLPGISITNVERILVTPAARKILGVDVVQGRLVLNSPEDKALGRLALVVSEVANRHINVSGLDTRDQRIDYAQKIAAQPLPKPIVRKSTGKSISTRPGATSTRRVSIHRNSLIPRQLKLAITQTRINRIYDELQRLTLDRFVNSAAVLLRVFIELSVDEFARRRKITLKVVPNAKPGKKAKPPRDMTLREKIKTVADHLEANTTASKSQLRGIRTLIANRYHVLSVDSLNSYVHSQDYNPTATELKNNWDNIEPFVVHLWI